MTSTASEAAIENVETKGEYMRVEGGVGRPASLNSAFPGASRQALAEACGVSLSHVCKIFNGYTPSLELAGKLARKLGVTVEEFVKELEQRKRERLRREQRERREKRHRVNQGSKSKVEREN